MAKDDYKGIWIFAEQEHGSLEPTVLELLAKAQELKAHNGESITAVLLGCDVGQLAETLFSYGADEVIVADHPALKEYSARPYEKALTQLVEKYGCTGQLPLAVIWLRALWCLWAPGLPPMQ